jgi:hypothetical protein
MAELEFLEENFEENDEDISYNFLVQHQPLWASHLVVLVDETTQTPITTLQGFPILVGLGIPLFWNCLIYCFENNRMMEFRFLFPFSPPQPGCCQMSNWALASLCVYVLAGLYTVFHLFIFFWASGRHLTGTSSPGLISFETFPQKKNKNKRSSGSLYCIYLSQRFAGHSLSLMVIERKR